MAYTNATASAIRPLQFNPSMYKLSDQPGVIDNTLDAGLLNPGGFDNRGSAGLETVGEGRNASLGLKNQFATTPLTDQSESGRFKTNSDLAQGPAMLSERPKSDTLEDTLSAVNTGANLINAGAGVAKMAGVGASTAAAAATTGAATGMGFLAALPGIASGIGAVGSLVSMGVQWYYASKQLSEEKNNAMIRDMREREASAEEKRRFEINLDLTKRQLAEDDRRARVAEALSNRKQGLEEYSVKETFKLKKEEMAEAKRINQVNQAINLMMGTLNMFNSAANKQETYNFWANRAK
jgi:hypothetical protein